MTAPIQDLRDAMRCCNSMTISISKPIIRLTLTPSWPVFIAISARAAP